MQQRLTFRFALGPGGHAGGRQLAGSIAAGGLGRRGIGGTGQHHHRGCEGGDGKAGKRHQGLLLVDFVNDRPHDMSDLRRGRSPENALARASVPWMPRRRPGQALSSSKKCQKSIGLLCRR
jgi:hypothetical protein